MSEHVSDTGAVGRPLCVQCDPNVDITIERDRYYQPCAVHLNPDRDGVDDGLVQSDAYLSGNAEAGGTHNAAICRLIHGARP
jgi:hypothetical protein